jgi:ADP-heptose:LPS heptosyltransferase
LQYGETTEQISLYNQQAVKPIIDFEFDKKNDIDQLLALIDACDLIVTISNITAHLACALGKNCLVILPAGGTLLWYWHLNGSVSPWYQSAILLRQKEIGNWCEVGKEIAYRVKESLSGTIAGREID